MWVHGAVWCSQPRLSSPAPIVEPASVTGHGYKKHQKQNNSPLINQLELVRDTISYIITGLQSNSITSHLDSSDSIQLPLVCVFV